MPTKTTDAAARYYRALLDLTRAPSLTLLDEILALLAEVTAADLIYVEVSVDGPRLRRTWSRTSQREAMSAALVESALSSRATTTSSSAACAPISVGPPCGFVYCERGSDSVITEAACEHVELLATQIALVVERFDHAFRRRRIDNEVRLLQRRRVIESLQADHGNLTATARELRVSRTFLYRVTRDTKRL